MAPGLARAEYCGGPVDVEFVDGTAYVLVGMVGLLFGAGVDGIYRVDGPDSFSVVADIGTWDGAFPGSPA